MSVVTFSVNNFKYFWTMGPWHAPWIRQCSYAEIGLSEESGQSVCIESSVYDARVTFVVKHW